MKLWFPKEKRIKVYMYIFIFIFKKLELCNYQSDYCETFFERNN